MNFKENVLAKICRDKLKRTVSHSLSSNSGNRKTNKKAMADLLLSAGYHHDCIRETDLYLLDDTDDVTDIIVLDNELACYRTSLADVLLRKSPTLKEMISIRNAIKILNDSDVVTGKGDKTIDKVHWESLEKLDLHFNAQDIKKMFGEYEMDFRVDHLESVRESVSVFSELAGFTNVPVFLEERGTLIRCRKISDEENRIKYGPFVIYDEHGNNLKQVDAYVFKSEKQKILRLKAIIQGKDSPSRKGRDVYSFFIQEILDCHFQWPYKFN